MLVKTNNSNRFNVTVTLPGVGTVTPNKDGEFQHDDEEAVNELIGAIPDFFVPVNTSAPVDKSTGGEEIPNGNDGGLQDLGVKSISADNDKDLIEGGDDTQVLSQAANQEQGVELPTMTAEEKVAARAELGRKRYVDLQELAKPFPGGEWRTKNKEDLVVYLSEKLNLL